MSAQGGGEQRRAPHLRGEHLLDLRVGLGAEGAGPDRTGGVEDPVQRGQGGEQGVDGGLVGHVRRLVSGPGAVRTQLGEQFVRHPRGTSGQDQFAGAAACEVACEGRTEPAGSPGDQVRTVRRQVLACRGHVRHEGRCTTDPAPGAPGDGALGAGLVGGVQLAFQGVDAAVEGVVGGQVDAAGGEPRVFLRECEGEAVRECPDRVCPLRRQAGDVGVLGDDQQPGAVGVDGKQVEYLTQRGGRGGVRGPPTSVSGALLSPQPHHGVRRRRVRPVSEVVPQDRDPTAGEPLGQGTAKRPAAPCQPHHAGPARRRERSVPPAESAHDRLRVGPAWPVTVPLERVRRYRHPRSPGGVSGPGPVQLRTPCPQPAGRLQQGPRPRGVRASARACGKSRRQHRHGRSALRARDRTDGPTKGVPRAEFEERVVALLQKPRHRRTEPHRPHGMRLPVRGRETGLPCAGDRAQHRYRLRLDRQRLRGVPQRIQDRLQQR